MSTADDLKRLSELYIDAMDTTVCPPSGGGVLPTPDHTTFGPTWTPTTRIEVGISQEDRDDVAQQVFEKLKDYLECKQQERDNG